MWMLVNQRKRLDLESKPFEPTKTGDRDIDFKNTKTKSSKNENNIAIAENT